jgi:hypothetical protein
MAWVVLLALIVFCAAPFAWRALANRFFGQDGG